MELERRMGPNFRRPRPAAIGFSYLPRHRIGPAAGLASPKVVIEATDAYLEDEDTKQWVDDACIVARDQWAPTDVLFASWQDSG